MKQQAMQREINIAGSLTSKRPEIIIELKTVDYGEHIYVTYFLASFVPSPLPRPALS